MTKENNNHFDQVSVNFMRRAQFKFSKHRVLARSLAIAGSAILATSLFSEVALAAAEFNIEKGITSATTPLIKAVSDHWGKAVLLTGCAGAVIGEGDTRQRAMRAATSSATAGGVILGLLAMFYTAP